MNIKLLILDKALKSVGEQEIPENEGFVNPAFEELMRKYGWRTNWSWCASFVRMIYCEALLAGGYNETSISLMESILSHSVHQTYKNIKKSSLFEFTDKPEYGDIVLWDTGHGHGHEGIFLANKINYHIETIDGNTNSYGSSNGEYVDTRIRSLNTKWKLLGYAKLNLDELYKITEAEQIKQI